MEEARLGGAASLCEVRLDVIEVGALLALRLMIEHAAYPFAERPLGRVRQRAC